MNLICSDGNTTARSREKDYIFTAPGCKHVTFDASGEGKVTVAAKHCYHSVLKNAIQHLLLNTDTVGAWYCWGSTAQSCIKMSIAIRNFQVVFSLGGSSSCQSFRVLTLLLADNLHA